LTAVRATASGSTTDWENNPLWSTIDEAMGVQGMKAEDAVKRAEGELKRVYES
jgi:hypothetical protein